MKSCVVAIDTCNKCSQNVKLLVLEIFCIQGCHAVLIFKIYPCFEDLRLIKFCCPYFQKMSSFLLASLFLSYFLISSAFVEGVFSVVLKQSTKA